MVFDHTSCGMLVITDHFSSSYFYHIGFLRQNWINLGTLFEPKGSADRRLQLLPELLPLALHTASLDAGRHMG